MLIIDLIRYQFFSNEFVVSNYPDFPFYAMVAENLVIHKVESPFNYLINFDISIQTAVYHYFDVYTLALMNRVGIPSFFAYTYIYFPLIKTIACISLVDILETLPSKRKVLNNYLIAFFAVFSISFGIDGGALVEQISYYFPKVIYSIIGFYFIYLWVIEKECKYLIFIFLVSFYLSPLVLLITFCSASLLVLIDFFKRNYLGIISTLRHFIKARYIIPLVVTFSFSGILPLIERDELSLTMLDNNNSSSIKIDLIYMKQMLNRILSYLSVVKYRPHFLLLIAAAFILLVKKLSTKSKVFKLTFLILVFALVGHVLSGIMIFHSESYQLHQLGFEMALLCECWNCSQFCKCQGENSKNYWHLRATCLWFRLLRLWNRIF